MAYKFALEFKSQKMLHDFISYMVDELMHIADEMCFMMRNYSDKVKNSGWVVNLIEISLKEIKVEVGSNTWLAWLDNYGSGSKMSTENPHLYEYIQSDYWNKWRNEAPVWGEVVARPKGSYKGIDGKIHEGSGRRDSEGLPMSLERTISKRTGKPLYKPIPPTFFMENTFRNFEKRFFDHMQEAIQYFPFEKYLKGGADKRWS